MTEDETIGSIGNYPVNEAQKFYLILVTTAIIPGIGLVALDNALTTGTTVAAEVVDATGTVLRERRR